MDYTAQNYKLKFFDSKYFRYYNFLKIILFLLFFFFASRTKSSATATGFHTVVLTWSNEIKVCSYEK